MTKKIVILINGSFNQSLDATNRNVQFGDGLFETCVIKQGKLLFWYQHFRRLQKGCDRLNILEVKESIWLNDIQKLINKSRLNNGIIKLILSRGNSQQGYQYHQVKPIRIVSIMPMINTTQGGLLLTICQKCYGHNNQLAGIKHCNRLDNILASDSIVDGVDDCIMLDEQQHIISTTKANIFIIKNDVLITPELIHCGIAGTRREVILELATLVNLSVSFTPITLEALYQADEVFISNSLLGLHQVAQIDKVQYNQSKHTQSLQTLLSNTENESSHTVKPNFPVVMASKIMAFVALFGLVWFLLINQNLINTQADVFEVKPNESVQQIAKNLKTKKLIHSFYYLEILTKLKFFNPSVQAGFYQLTSKMRITQLMNNIHQGKTIRHSINFKLGQTIQDYYQQLKKHAYIITPDTLETTLNLANIVYPYQGILLAGTYTFDHLATGGSIFKQAYQKGIDRMNYYWQKRDKSITLTSPYQGIILASIIQKEALNPSEKQDISGVLNRRLKYNMYLQAPSSLVYALTYDNPNKTKPINAANYTQLIYLGQLIANQDDLQIDSLYNTYRYKNLPPSAISTVSDDSLYSALHPSGGKALYFTPSKNNQHIFSDTYEQHLKHLKQYIE